MIELVQIPKENTDTVWHLCKGMIANALARSNGYASETHFKKWIKDEKMQLWFLWDSELDIQDRLYGVWQHLINKIEDFAKEEGCQMMELIARPGWQKIYNNYGYKRTHVVLEKQIKQEEIK